MNPLALIGLMSSGANNLFSMAGGFLSSKKQFSYNKELQQRAFDHQIRLMQNAHQWEVDDLRNAGLNPILSSHSSSSVGSAPSASVSAPNFSFDNVLDSIVKLQGFSSARDLQKYAKENHMVDLASKEADLARKDAEADYIRAQTNNLDASTARSIFDLQFLEDENYNELRRLELLHKVFPIDGEIGFNVGKGKRGKGFGANLNLGDTYSAFGRSAFYKKMSKEDVPRILIKKEAPNRVHSTRYNYKYYKN